jgi:cobyrinic acid a,c-diamide synthase
MAKFRPNLPFSGVIANRVNSERHIELLSTSLPKEFTFYGRMPKDETITLPERHLGLVQAQELSDIDVQLDKAASHIANTGLTELPVAVEFFYPSPTSNNLDLVNGRDANGKEIDNNQAKPLVGTRIVIIKDSAFSFVYAANIAFLQQAGAELIYSSALNDAHLPDGDILYIPGGYPELYAQQLVDNVSFLNDVRAFAESKKPIVAECGGMLYLLDQLTDMDGQHFSMLGLLPGKAVMQKKLTAIGSQWVALPLFEQTKEKPKATTNNNIMRGHSFHYSSADIELEPLCQTTHHPSERAGEFVYQHNNILASYMHWYFPSNPELTLRMFDKTVSVK